tara:strand:- start:783 stop:1835 length:1053 start_codon:yes stop_codon:yes gene_type:complete
MAYSTITKGSAHFNTKIYTGTGSSNAITGVGFQPDFVWIKKRNGSPNHALFDVLRGVTKYLESSSNAPDQTDSNSLSQFDSDGFTVISKNSVNSNGDTYVSWNWKGGGSGTTNNDGSIQSTVSVNNTAGFSIVKYTGYGGTSTVGHGMNVAPTLLINKNISTNSTSWFVGGWGDWTKRMKLEGTNDWATNTVWNDTAPTDQHFSLNGNNANQSGQDYICYCFAEKAGFSKFGTLESVGNDSGTFTYCGFAPQLVMVKPTVSDSWSNWYVFDNVRRTYNLNDKPLYWNLSTQEAYYGGSPASNYAQIDITSTGFKIRRDGNWGAGGSGADLNYMAFGQTIVGSNNIPVVAR